MMYMNTKRMQMILAVLLISVMMLCACGQKNTPPAENSPAAEASPAVQSGEATAPEETASTESPAPSPTNSQEPPQLSVVSGDSQETDKSGSDGQKEELDSYEGLTPEEVVEIFNTRASGDINESIHMRMEYPGRFPDDHTDSKTPGGMREDRDDKGIDLVMWVDGLSKDVFLISMGDEAALDDYLLFLNDAKKVQTEYQKRITEYFPDIKLRLRVIEDTESDGTLAVLEDGKIVYDTADAEELQQYLDIRDMLQGANSGAAG